MADRLHPQSNNDLRQLIKLHGISPLLDALTQIGRTEGFLNADQQIGLQPGRPETGVPALRSIARLIIRERDELGHAKASEKREIAPLLNHALAKVNAAIALLDK